MTQIDHGRREDDLQRIITRTGTAVWVLGALAIACATLTPSGQPPTNDSLCLVCGELGGVDVLLNVLLFMPLGTGLAMRRVQRWRALSVMSLGSILIELSQLTFVPGRDASPGDVVTNSIGGAIGYAVGASLMTLVAPPPRKARRLSLAWLAAWVLVQAAASYTLEPSPTESVYYGQLARALGGEPAYPGRILGAQVGPLVFPDWDFKDSRVVAALMRAGTATTSVIVERRGMTERLTSIARIADGSEREILLLGADGGDMVFGIRTHASALRLRPPYYRLAGGLSLRGAGTAAADVVRLRGTYAPPRVRLESASRTGEVRASVRVTPASAWRSIALMTVYDDDSARGALLDAMWLSLLLLPAGYWLLMALRGGEQREHAVLLATALATLAIGFAEAPLAFGLAVPAWWEFAGALAGLAVGALVAFPVARWLDQRGRMPSR